MDEPFVLTEKRGALGLITLNRPQALNALNRDMARAIHAALDLWATDPAVAAVAIRGRGRAFCAGGDVRALADGVARLGPQAAVFLADEYRLNAAVAALPKPYVALCHGYVMGGGAGLSVHGAYRLAAPSLSFAMPETAIGFVPDVGATHFLSRCPGAAGLYLGLTGARIGAGDAIALGLMTHAVEEDCFGAVIDALAAGRPAGEVVAAFCRAAPAPALERDRPRIDAIFSAPSVEGILERLERDGSAFALATLHQLRAMSPSALKFTFRAIRAGAGLPLRDCLAMEYRVALRAIQAHDFAEGVRAQLVDKDRAPRWRPERLAALPDAVIDAYFAPMDDLTFA
jgi:enoyl-CoA hydratase